MGAGSDDAPVQLVDKLGTLGRRTGYDFGDRLEPVLLVAGVDALRAVATEKILVIFHARQCFHDWHADFFGSPWINRGFENNDIAGFEQFSNRTASAFQRAEIRALVIIDGGRNGDDVDVTISEVLRIAGIAQVRRCDQFCWFYLQRAVFTAAKLINTGLVYI